ncbi:hypothetical protein GCM10010435_52860 [Winogradskya consettensis]|uniref:SMI1/KNR4 family protein n=1 Tax=Winogradskya consettensis TaxID=113560 RepID=A0A919SHC6_9ACTN|nr:hypothetical protein Aco04nite_26580 [Actinoplanes consettensis]
MHAALELAVRDAAGAWRFVEMFAERYATPLLEKDGYGDAELRSAEAALGFGFPEALLTAYRRIGRRFDLTRSQDVLLSPDRVYLDYSGEVLVFRVENQNVVQWGIPLSAIAEPDPPVLLRLESGWRPYLDRVSLACVEMVLSEWMLAGDDGPVDNRELDDEAVVTLEQRFRRLPMPDYVLWADPDGKPMRWFSGLGAILREDAGHWLWVRADNAEAVTAVRRALPGDWLMVDD